MGADAVSQASASGACTLTLTCVDGRLSLALARAGAPPLARVALSGVRASRPLAGARAAAAGRGARFALDGGAELALEPHPTLDLFTVRVSAAAAAPPVGAEFALRELGACFGLGHLMRQPWPLQDGALELGAFYPFDNGPSGLCTLAIPTVVGTSGVAVSCSDRSRCLHVSLNAARSNVTSGVPYKWGVGVANFDRMVLPRPASEAPGDGLLTLQSRAAYDWPHVRHPWLRPPGETGGAGGAPCLEFTLGAAANVREATERLVLGRLLLEEAPGGRSTPPEAMLRDPIWTTWARYKDAVTEADVVAFAEEIAARGLPRSVMEVDDRWSVNYGDLEFDRAKFPDPAAMTARLHALGFLVTLWVIPFANTDSEAVRSPETRGFFVRDAAGGVGEFDWWQPTRVAALDVTNPAACAWFLSRLERLRAVYGVDGFKFDAGEPCFLPAGAVTHTPLGVPADYTRAWVQRVAGRFPVAEVRAGVDGTQAAAPLLRLFDRFSTWGDDNGLASVVTALLTAGVLGYPFVLPDMIGGNAYGGDAPDAELMVRWAQATAAMPAMQFSIPPWAHGEEAAALCARALQWRADVFWPAIAAALPDAAGRLTPIARPMWWAAPGDAAAHAAADQFMVGPDLVVAPVVSRGATTRPRVFLPAGRWRRVVLAGREGAVDGAAVVAGPAVLRDVPAPLDELPTWRRAGGSVTRGA